MTKKKKDEETKNPFEKPQKDDDENNFLDKMVDRDEFIEKLPILLKNKKYDEVADLIINIFDGFHMMVLKNRIFLEILDTQIQAISNSLCPNVRKDLAETLISLKDNLPEGLIANEQEVLKDLDRIENEIKRGFSKKKDLIH